MFLNIGVIGVGGVGGYFGGKLLHRLPPDKVKTFFVARGKHLEAIRNGGLRVHTSDEGEWICKPSMATERIQDLPILDICLLAVKSFDLDNVCRLLNERITESTLILPLLNGVDIYERIRKHISIATVFPATVYVGTHIEEYGKVVQNGGACKILLGSDPQAENGVPNALLDLLSQSKIKHEWFDDVYPELWAKFAFIASFGLVTAAYDKTLGEIMESERLSEKVRAVMSEIAELAQRLNVVLPETAIADAYNKGNAFPYETKTSLQRDVERSDKPDERDLFGGTILRLGNQHGVETPVTQELNERLNKKKPLTP